MKTRRRSRTRGRGALHAGSLYTARGLLLAMGWGRSTVKRTNRCGRLLDIPAHAFLFCEWTGGSSVYLLGWCWSSLVAGKPLEDSSAGDWRNAVIDDSDLTPMASLRDELEVWRAARCL